MLTITIIQKSSKPNTRQFPKSLLPHSMLNQPKSNRMTISPSNIERMRLTPKRENLQGISSSSTSNNINKDINSTTKANAFKKNPSNTRYLLKRIRHLRFSHPPKHQSHLITMRPPNNPKFNTISNSTCNSNSTRISTSSSSNSDKIKWCCSLRKNWTWSSTSSRLQSAIAKSKRSKCYWVRMHIDLRAFFWESKPNIQFYSISPLY